MKPTFEKIDPEFGSSFYYEQFSKYHKNSYPTWHYHPEIELAYVNEGNGKIQIGSHVSNYTDGALIMIGSNLPHCGFTNLLTGERKETIVQLRIDVLGTQFLNAPELSGIKNLFELSKTGIIFHGKTKKELGSRIEAMQSLDSFQRLICLLEILRSMERSKERSILNAQGFAIEAEMEDSNRINIVFNYVRENFQNTIALGAIANTVNMSEPGFCRYFKKITGKTFTQFVNEYRLVHAAKLLHEKQATITEICLESGFNNFSHFNKLFKQFTGKTPSNYRNEMNFTVLT